MANMYQQPMPSGAPRLMELLDAVKNEVETISQESSVFKMHKDEYEHKISNQIQEMQNIQKAVYELEATHRRIKQDYEEEIMRLRRELESRDPYRLKDPQAAAGANRGAAGPAQPRQQPQQQPPPPPQQQQQYQQQPPSAASGAGGAPSTGMPSIGLGQMSLFGGVMSAGGAAGSNGQHASPAPSSGMPMTTGPPHDMAMAQPPSAPGGPYASANRYAPGGGYMNGGQQQQPPQQQPQPPPTNTHPSKRARTDDIKADQMGTGSSTPGGAGAPPGNRGSPIPGSNSGGIVIKNETPQQAATANSMAAANELDADRVPPEYKKEGSDWSVVFNPAVPRTLDINLVHSLEHQSVVCCVRFSDDGKYVATGCNRVAMIFDIKTGQRITTLQDDGPDEDGDLYVRSVAFSPDSKYLATGAEDRQIRLWDIAKKRVRSLFVGHEQDIYSLDYAKNGRYIASGSGDRTARVWDVETEQCVLTLSIEDGVTTIAISPDGQYVAAGSLDKVVRVWSMRGELVERLEGHRDSVYSVAFSPSGRELLSGSLDKTIKLWDLNLQSADGTEGDASNTGSKPGAGALTAGGGSATSGAPTAWGRCRTTFYGHKDFVLSVGLSPDGRWVVSGSKDRGVQFWDPKTAQTQFVLHGHKNSVISVSLSPKGRLFATGSGDYRARIWSYDSRE